MHDPVVLFESPARWRADAIVEEIPDGPERWASASPAPAFPQLLEMLQRAFAASPPGPILDIGAGLGGIAAAVASTTGRYVVAAEPSECSVAGAHRLFDNLPVVRARGHVLPIRQGSIAGVLLVGVTSLIADLTTLVAELQRIVVRGSRIVIVDLIADDDADLSRGPNRFRTLANLERALPGFVVVERAVAEHTVGSWMLAGERIDAHVAARHRHDDGYDAWVDDQRHLERELVSGRLLVGATSMIASGPT